MIIKKIARRIIRGEERNLEGINGDSNYNRINLEWYNGRNVGDYLSTVVYRYMIEKYNLDINHWTKKTMHISAIGSVLCFFNADTTVWGTGIIRKEDFKTLVDNSKKRKLDIRAVRGPVTRTALLAAGYNCPEIYGDPAILMPFIYNVPLEKEYEVSYIPHHSSQALKSEAPNDVHIIDVRTENYQFFIDEIRKSKKIISSSLHGIILAETYGVPVVYLNEVSLQMWKFFDWYLSTGRNDVKVSKTVEEAQKMNPMELPDLEEMQKKLIEVFPYDMWR